MMSKEMIKRINTASEYQKKAIRALFPEKMGGHLDIIEKELKLMAKEIITDFLKEYNESNVCDEEQPKVKKVDIV